MFSSHLETVKRVSLWEHLELGQFSDKSDRFIFGLDVDLVLLTHLRHKQEHNNKMSERHTL